MEDNLINAANNPGLANKLAQEAMATTQDAPEAAKIKNPSAVTVDLPGGYISPETGEVLRTAEVRELTGRDEEAIVKSSNTSKMLVTVLNRGTVSIGGVKASEEVLDSILVADRDAIMLGIYKATFGKTADLGAYCSGCDDFKTVQVDIDDDIQIKRLSDPLEDRRFTLQGRKNEFIVKLPEGKAQRDLSTNVDKTNSELDTMLLEYCVVAIDGKGALGRAQIQAIGLQDRRMILQEILKKNPGPQFEDVKTDCPECGGEVAVPISLGTLFRF